MHDDRPQKPNRWRMQHDEFVETETRQAGVYVYQRYDEPAIIDTLHDRRMIDDQMHGALREYREDCQAAGLWRSPPSAAYGEVTGGEVGSGLARTRVLQADGFISATCGTDGRNLLRNVTDDGATMPMHNGPPGWLRPFRMVAGRLAAWRRMDPDDVRRLRLSRVE